MAPLEHLAPRDQVRHLSEKPPRKEGKRAAPVFLRGLFASNVPLGFYDLSPPRMPAIQARPKSTDRRPHLCLLKPPTQSISFLCSRGRVVAGQHNLRIAAIHNSCPNKPATDRQPNHSSSTNPTQLDRTAWSHSHPRPRSDSLTLWLRIALCRVLWAAVSPPLRAKGEFFFLCLLGCCAILFLFALQYLFRRTSIGECELTYTTNHEGDAPLVVVYIFRAPAQITQ